MMFHHGQELISGYRLEKLLGRGSCGEVWRASAPGGTWTALKLINLEARGGLRELRGLQHVKNLRHGCLLPIHAIWVLDNDTRVLREDELDRLWSSTSPHGHDVLADLDQSVPGILVVSMMLGEGNLFDRMLECQQAGHAGIPVDELLGYMEDAARGLDFLNAERHDFGEGPIAIQHCDIKPQNIMLVGGTAMICDFGLARVLSSCRGTTLMPGSPAYIAPECISGKQPSFTTDQYSLAVSYVELRTGALPFQNTSISAVFDAHLKGTLDLSRLEGHEREVIRRATAVNPADRFSTTTEMVRSLRASIAPSVALSSTGMWQPMLTRQESEPASELTSGTMTPGFALATASGSTAQPTELAESLRKDDHPGDANPVRKQLKRSVLRGILHIWPSPQTGRVVRSVLQLAAAVSIVAITFWLQLKGRVESNEIAGNSQQGDSSFVQENSRPGNASSANPAQELKPEDSSASDATTNVLESTPSRAKESQLEPDPGQATSAGSVAMASSETTAFPALATSESSLHPAADAKADAPRDTELPHENDAPSPPLATLENADDPPSRALQPSDRETLDSQPDHTEVADSAPALQRETLPAETDTIVFSGESPGKPEPDESVKPDAGIRSKSVSPTLFNLSGSEEKAKIASPQAASRRFEKLPEHRFNHLFLTLTDLPHDSTLIRDERDAVADPKDSVFRQLEGLRFGRATWINHDPDQAVDGVIDMRYEFPSEEAARSYVTRMLPRLSENVPRCSNATLVGDDCHVFGPVDVNRTAGFEGGFDRYEYLYVFRVGRFVSKLKVRLVEKDVEKLHPDQASMFATIAVRKLRSAQ